MNIHEYKQVCMTPAQSELIDSVLAESDKSPATKEALKALRVALAESSVFLFSNEDADRIKLGLEPEWKSADIEWDTAFHLYKKPASIQGKIFGYLLQMAGLDKAIISLMFGVDIPKSKEGRYAMIKAIWVASVLDAC